jgi:di/tricarboxylate transporter
VDKTRDHRESHRTCAGLRAVRARSIEQVSSGSIAIVVVVLALTTTVMTNLITNAAAGSIITPVALGIATRLGLNPVTLLALVATCISFTFINRSVTRATS